MTKPSKRSPPPVRGLDDALRGLALLGVYGGLLTPLAFAPFVWHPFMAGKVWFLQLVVGLTFPAWLVLVWRQPAYRPPRTLLGAAVLAKLASIALSLPFAEDWQVGLWGSTDKMDGLVYSLHLTAWFAMALSLLRTDRAWRGVLGAVVLGGGLSAVVAIVQVWFPGLLGTVTGTRVSGTLGNPVFLGAFHLQVLFLTAFLWTWQTELSRRWKLVAGTTAALSLVVFPLTGSRGVLLGVVVGLIAATVAYILFTGKRRLAFILAGALLLAAGGYLTILQVARPHPALAEFWARHAHLRHFFEARGISDRLQFVQLTRSAIAERPLFGWGQRNFEVLYARHYDPWEGCADRALNDPHNLFLELLSTKGVVGLGAYLFLWVISMGVVIRAVRRNALGALPGSLLLGLLVGSHVPLMFNPDSPGTLFISFLTWALIAHWAKPQPESAAPPMTPVKGRRWALPPAVAASLALALFVSVLPAYAAAQARRARAAMAQGNLARSWEALRAAVSVPSPYLEDSLAAGTGLLMLLAETRSLERFPAWQQLLSLNRQLAARYQQHHHRVRQRMLLPKALQLVGAATGNRAYLEEAEAALRLLVEEQPQRQEVLYIYGSVLADQGKLVEAEQVFQKAVSVEPRVGQSHFRLGVFHWNHRGDPELGSRLMREAMVAACPFAGASPTEMLQLAQALVRQQDLEGLRALAKTTPDRPGDPSGQMYLLFARYLEEAGLMEERNLVLQATLKYAPAAGRHARAVLEGRVKSVAALYAPKP